MAGKKRKGNGSGRKIAPIIIGVVIVLCSLIPVSESLFGLTGYITEIHSSERIGGEQGDGNLPNTYQWSVGYTFKTKSGEYMTGSMTTQGDAISSKSGLRAGSPVRYLAFAPKFNTPGEGMFDGSTIMYVLLAAFGVFMITLGVRKEKPSKTPAQRSGEYRAARAARENQSPAVQTKPACRVNVAQPVYSSGDDKMSCENCGTQLDTGAKFCKSCGASRQAPAIEPEWDSFAYDGKTALTQAEVDELYGIATEEEIEEEFDLINSGDEGSAYYRKVLDIVRWRRANGQ